MGAAPNSPLRGQKGSAFGRLTPFARNWGLPPFFFVVFSARGPFPYKRARTMQRHILVAATSIATSTLFLGACAKKEPPPPPPVAEEAKPAAPAGADPAKFLTQPLDID